MTIGSIISTILQCVTLIGIVVTGVISILKIFSGQRCLLRSEMLRIYYKNKGFEKIRQYEYENFVLMYAAYKKLGGNSFIDDIYEKVKKWTVVT